MLEKQGCTGIVDFRRQAVMSRSNYEQFNEQGFELLEPFSPHPLFTAALKLATLDLDILFWESYPKECRDYGTVDLPAAGLILETEEDTKIVVTLSRSVDVPDSDKQSNMLMVLVYTGTLEQGLQLEAVNYMAFLRGEVIDEQGPYWEGWSVLFLPSTTMKPEEWRRICGKEEQDDFLSGLFVEYLLFYSGLLSEWEAKVLEAKEDKLDAFQFVLEASPSAELEASAYETVSGFIPSFFPVVVDGLVDVRAIYARTVGNERCYIIPFEASFEAGATEISSEAEHYLSGRLLCYQWGEEEPTLKVSICTSRRFGVVQNTHLIFPHSDDGEGIEFDESLSDDASESAVE